MGGGSLFVNAYTVLSPAHPTLQYCWAPHPTPPMRRQSFMALNKWQPPSLPPSYFISPFGFCSVIPPHPSFVQLEGGGGAFVVLPLLWPRVKPPTLRTVSWGLSSKILLGGFRERGKEANSAKENETHIKEKSKEQRFFFVSFVQSTSHLHILTVFRLMHAKYTCTHPRRRGGPFSFFFPPHLSTPQRKKEKQQSPYIFACNGRGRRRRKRRRSYLEQIWKRRRKNKKEAANICNGRRGYICGG